MWAHFNTIKYTGSLFIIEASWFQVFKQLAIYVQSHTWLKNLSDRKLCWNHVTYLCPSLPLPCVDYVVSILKTYNVTRNSLWRIVCPCSHVCKAGYFQDRYIALAVLMHEESITLYCRGLYREAAIWHPWRLKS